MIDESSEIAQIMLELGVVGGSVVANALPAIWSSYADKAAIGPRLQALYTKRAAVDILLGSVWEDVDTDDEQLKVALHQRGDQLSAIRQSVEAEISDVSARLRAARSPAKGPIRAGEREERKEHG